MAGKSCLKKQHLPNDVCGSLRSNKALATGARLCVSFINLHVETTKRRSENSDNASVIQIEFKLKLVDFEY